MLLMTRSVYIIGGAGTGKSTFMKQLLLGEPLGPLEDLCSLANKGGNIVTLRGHRVFHNGMYLGVMRKEFPGSDGLDRASSPTGERWLEDGDLPDLIISEGATLATRRFLNALNLHTNLLLVHLTVDPEIAMMRFKQRGSDQAPSFVTNTVTRSANLVRDIDTLTLTIDSDDSFEWINAIDICRSHLRLKEKIT